MNYRIEQLEKENARLNARLDKLEHEQPRQITTRMEECFTSRLRMLESAMESRWWGLFIFIAFGFFMLVLAIAH